MKISRDYNTLILPTIALGQDPPPPLLDPRGSWRFFEIPDCPVHSMFHISSLYCDNITPRLLDLLSGYMFYIPGFKSGWGGGVLVLSCPVILALWS